MKHSHSLFPNPVRDFLIIENGYTGESFFIVNIEGQTVKKFIVEVYPYRLDVSGLVQGVYFLRGKETSIKFIKEGN